MSYNKATDLAYWEQLPRGTIVELAATVIDSWGENPEQIQLKITTIGIVYIDENVYIYNNGDDPQKNYTFRFNKISQRSNLGVAQSGTLFPDNDFSPTHIISEIRGSAPPLVYVQIPTTFLECIQVNYNKMGDIVHVFKYRPNSFSRTVCPISSWDDIEYEPPDTISVSGGVVHGSSDAVFYSVHWNLLIDKRILNYANDLDTFVAMLLTVGDHIYENVDWTSSSLLLLQNECIANKIIGFF